MDSSLCTGVWKTLLTCRMLVLHDILQVAQINFYVMIIMIKIIILLFIHFKNYVQYVNNFITIFSYYFSFVFIRVTKTLTQYFRFCINIQYILVNFYFAIDKALLFRDQGFDRYRKFDYDDLEFHNPLYFHNWNMIREFNFFWTHNHSFAIYVYT